mmetsp:Transcript_13493/g.31061  ORF Transcript_13493/g.31061 Transcript_13493/m.31061 type:complete len:268 (-) Transcript_13493:113-916(-)
MQDDKVNELMPQELAWFRELKLLCQTHQMDVSSDYEIACYAIVSKGSTVKALSRMAKMKKLEKAHNLSAIDSVKAYETVVELCPGMFSACGRDRKGRPAIFFDFSKCLPSAITQGGEEAWRCVLKVLLDAFDASTSTIHDVREGTSWLCNCHGMGWRNFSFEMEKKISMLYQDGYPIKIKAMYLSNPPFILNAMITICKVFLKKKLQERIKIIQQQQASDYFDGQDIPRALAGGCQVKYEDWLKDQLATRQHSIAEFAAKLASSAST